MKEDASINVPEGQLPPRYQTRRPPPYYRSSEAKQGPYQEMWTSFKKFPICTTLTLLIGLLLLTALGVAIGILSKACICKYIGMKPFEERRNSNTTEAGGLRWVWRHIGGSSG